jgi:hypothetical protein
MSKREEQTAFEAQFDLGREDCDPSGDTWCQTMASWAVDDYGNPIVVHCAVHRTEEDTRRDWIDVIRTFEGYLDTRSDLIEYGEDTEIINRKLYEAHKRVLELKDELSKYDIFVTVFPLG